MADIIQTQDSRRVFVDTLIELAEKNNDILLVTCDVGFNYLEKFSKRFPKQFLNLGVTEQSSVMVATGLALSGFRVYLYSMINFVLFRPAEMVRNGVVCHKAPVTLVGVKGSEKYKFLGFSHNLLHDKEDFNFCDNIVLKWWNPQFNEAVRTDVIESYRSGEPAYIRLQ